MTRPLIQLILMATKSWKWLPAMCVSLHRCKEKGTVLKRDRSGVVIFTGWGSLGVKLEASIVVLPHVASSGKPMKRELGCIIEGRGLRAKR